MKFVRHIRNFWNLLYYDTHRDRIDLLLKFIVPILSIGLAAFIYMNEEDHLIRTKLKYELDIRKLNQYQELLDNVTNTLAKIELNKNISKEYLEFRGLYWRRNQLDDQKVRKSIDSYDFKLSVYFKKISQPLAPETNHTGLNTNNNNSNDIEKERAKEKTRMEKVKKRINRNGEALIKECNRVMNKIVDSYEE